VTVLRVRNRFQPDPIIAAFPGLLTFRGSPPDGNGVTEIEGRVDPADLERLVRKSISRYDLEQTPHIELIVDTEPTVKARRHLPWRLTVIAASSFAAGSLTVELVRVVI
jgi:hypothetical protein